MTRQRYRGGQWWSEDQWDAMLIQSKAARAANPMKAPMVIRDGMDATMNPVNGQHYDSKRAYERAVRDAGCVIVGNEAPTHVHMPPPVGGVEQDIKTAIDQLSAGQ